MSQSKIEQILEIAKNADNAERIIVFVNSFKVVGYICQECKDYSKKNGLLTLRNATICNSLENFECTFSHHTYNWLNIFEDEIIGFSVTKDENTQE